MEHPPNPLRKGETFGDRVADGWQDSCHPLFIDAQSVTIR